MGEAWCCYFMQGEDGEEEAHPNIFRVPGASREVLLSQFVDNFPLRKHGGQYHFRFRAPDAVSGFCWLDLREPSAALPRYDDMICAKVLRLDRLPRQRPSRLRRKPVQATLPKSAGFGASGIGSATPAARPPAPDSSPRAAMPAEAARSQSAGGNTGTGQRARSASPLPARPPGPAARGSSNGAVGASSPVPSGHRQQDARSSPNSSGDVSDLLFGGSDASPAAPSGRNGGPNDLLNFDADPVPPAAGSGSWHGNGSSHQQRPPPAAAAPNSATAPRGSANVGGGGSAADLMNMGGGGGAGAWGAAAGMPPRAQTAPNSPERPGMGLSSPNLMAMNGGGGGGGQSAYVLAMKEGRRKKLEEDTAKALKFKKDIDAAAVKEQEELDTAKARHDARLTTWAEDHGKKRNVRTLLSTMHTVLWDGCKWQPASMADLIQPNKVKLQFRKAMLVVHPDKCVDVGPEPRFIAKRVFEALNEAYAAFAQQELG